MLHSNVWHSPKLLSLLFLLTLSGCMVGPNFLRPKAQVPADWVGPVPASEPAPAEASGKDLADWWTTFEDPTLTRLVNAAVDSNLDLRRAQSRVRQARAVRGIVAAGLGPQVDATASAERGRTPGTTTSRGTTVEGVTSNQFRAGFDASWEIDIFGGVRREVEAAEADILGAIENLRDVLVSLTAEVANTYMDIRSFQQRIVIARQNLAAQKHSADLTRQRYEGGFVSGLDVANAEAQVATTASLIPLLESFLRQAMYRMAVLLGREPGALVAELTAVQEIPSGERFMVPVGLPSDLLRRRPDIRRAEAGIHAETARIGVATADLFPRFNILGSAGYRASSTGNWFESNSRFWSLGPSMNWPIFTMGRVRSNIEQREAIQEQALVTYEQTVLTALGEVEGALIASLKEQEHRAALIQAVAANRKAVRLSTILYTEGQTDFLNVLNAQRALYLSEDALVQSTRDVSANLIALYKALGGGWEESDYPDSIASQ